MSINYTDDRHSVQTKTPSWMILILAVLSVSCEVRGRPLEPPIFQGFLLMSSELKVLWRNENSILRRTQMASCHLIVLFWDFCSLLSRFDPWRGPPGAESPNPHTELFMRRTCLHCVKDFNRISHAN